MISKEYTIEEAFKIGLLEHGERVCISSLYFPTRFILKKIEDTLHTVSINYIDAVLTKVPLFRSPNNEIFVQFNAGRYMEKEIAELISSNLLTYEPYLRATSNLLNHKGRYCFKIVTSPEVIVHFLGKEEFPTLKLPLQTAYLFD